jgi:hypothetical protein
MVNHRRVFYHEFWLMDRLLIYGQGSDFVAFVRESATVVTQGGKR